MKQKNSALSQKMKPISIMNTSSCSKTKVLQWSTLPAAFEVM
jgi:hypothetical protein